VHPGIHRGFFELMTEPVQNKADKVVELKYLEQISYETIRQVLKKTKLNHGAIKGV